MKILILSLASTLFLTSCTLSFRLKGYVYNHSIMQMEKEYVDKAKSLLGEAPAASVYIAGLKKYNRLKNVTEVSLGEGEAEYVIEKTLLKPDFAQEFLNFLVDQAKNHPTRKSQEVLAEFIKTHPEPWPAETFKAKLLLRKDGDQWVVQSETRI